jgi:hypothetical protein
MVRRRRRPWRRRGERRGGRVKVGFRGERGRDWAGDSGGSGPRRQRETYGSRRSGLRVRSSAGVELMWGFEAGFRPSNLSFSSNRILKCTKILPPF